jgi:hypothetical protein
MRDGDATATALRSSLALIAAIAPPLSQPVASHSNGNQTATAAAISAGADGGGSDRQLDDGLRHTNNRRGPRDSTLTDRRHSNVRPAHDSCADHSAQLDTPHRPAACRSCSTQPAPTRPDSTDSIRFDSIRFDSIRFAAAATVPVRLEHAAQLRQSPRALSASPAPLPTLRCNHTVS